MFEWLALGQTFFYHVTDNTTLYFACWALAINKFQEKTNKQEKRQRCCDYNDKITETKKKVIQSTLEKDRPIVVSSRLLTITIY